MSDPDKSKVVYPVRLEGVQITKAQQRFITREIERRGGGTRLRNGVVRDFIDFADDNYTFFLAWIAARGNVA